MITPYRFSLFGALLCFCCFSFFRLSAQSQIYELEYFPLAGNPGGLNQEMDFDQTGWTYLDSYGDYDPNHWSPIDSLPFPFTFFDSAVTEFKISGNGLLTFSPLAPWNSAFNHKLNPENPLLPALTISALHSHFFSDYQRIESKVFGPVGSRQFWIRGVGNGYNACVLEEGTNAIYIVEYSGSHYNFPTFGILGVRQDTSWAQNFYLPNLAPYTSSQAPGNNSFAKLSRVPFQQDLAIQHTVFSDPTPRGRHLSELSLQDSISLTTQIHNTGPNPASSFQVQLLVNGSLVEEQSFFQTLLPQDSLLVSFDSLLNFTVPDTYEVWVMLVHSQDQIPWNDTSVHTFVNVPNEPLEMPYEFEANNPLFAFLYYPVTDSLVGIPAANGLDFFPDSASQGRLRSNKWGFPIAGNRAIILDGEGNGGPHHVDMTLNLSESDTSQYLGLSFSLRRHFLPFDPADGVWARGSEVDPWLRLVNFDSLGLASWASLFLLEVPLGEQLMAAGQQVSPTTQIRFSVRSDAFTGIFQQPAGGGYTIDNIRIQELPYDDLNLINLAPIPIQNFCGQADLSWRLVVQNKGLNPSPVRPIEIELWREGSLEEEFTVMLDSIQPNESGYLDLSELDVRWGGNINLIARSVWDKDQISGNDSIVATRFFYPQTTPEAQLPPSACVGESITLSAQTRTGLSYAWFSTFDRDSLISRGPELLTDPLSDSRSYYLGYDPKYETGAPDRFIGPGSFASIANQATEFHLSFPVNLDSVTVYPIGSGLIQVNIRANSGGTILQSRSIPISGGTGQPVRIGLDFSLGSGTHFIDAAGSTIDSLYVNLDGGEYPYLQPGLFSLRRARPIPSQSNTSEVYFFYDWLVDSRGFPCWTQLAEVPVDVFAAPPVADFSSTQSGWTVDFSSQAIEAEEMWYDFGDGNTSTEVNPSHSYAQGGAYEVQQIVQNACGTDTLTQLLQVGITSVEALTDFGIELYPNPANETAYLRLNLATAETLSLRLFDSQGRQLWSEDSPQLIGELVRPIPLTTLPKGIYLLRLDIGHTSLFRKLERN